MKTFEVASLFFEWNRKDFDESNPPEWMIHPEYRWWYDANVLTLEVGQSISTDFNKITRTS